MGVLGKVPGVEDYAGILFVVVWKLLGSSKALCEKSVVVLKMKSAGKETALLEDAGDVAGVVLVARAGGDGDMIEVEKVIVVGVVVPFGVCKLFVVADIGVTEIQGNIPSDGTLAYIILNARNRIRNLNPMHMHPHLDCLPRQKSARWAQQELGQNRKPVLDLGPRVLMALDSGSRVFSFHCFRY